MVLESKKLGQLTPDLAKVVMAIAEGLYRRFNYQIDLEDYQQEALLLVSRKLQKLNSRKNLFSYLTQMIKNLAAGRCRSEKTYRTKFRQFDPDDPL